MRIEDLVIFTDVVRYHSMNIASEKHFMSPQNLSKIIRNIENELDVVLFKRSKKGSELTEEGERFYLRVQKVLKEYDKALEEIHHMERWCVEEQQIVETVKIKVLCNQGATNYAVLNACHALQEKKIYDIRLDINLIDIFKPDRLFDCVSREVYDVIICSLQEIDLEKILKNVEGYILVHVIQDEFVLLLSEKNSLSEKKEISLSELEPSKLVLSKESSVYDRFSSAGNECKIVANSMNMIVKQVEHSEEFYTLVCKSFVDLLVKTDINSPLTGIPINEKLYVDYIVLLNEKVSGKKEMREFIKEIIKNFSTGKSY